MSLQRLSTNCQIALQCRSLLPEGLCPDVGQLCSAATACCCGNHAHLWQPIPLKDKCIRTLIQGTTFSQFSSILSSCKMPQAFYLDLMSVALHRAMSPAMVTTMLSSWHLTNFSLIDVFNRAYPLAQSPVINAFNVLIWPELMYKLAEQFVKQARTVIAILGRSSFKTVTTLDLSGMPIPDEALGCLVRLTHTQAETSKTVIIDVSVEVENIDLLIRLMSLDQRSPLLRVAIANLHVFCSFYMKKLNQLLSLLSPEHVRGISLRYVRFDEDPSQIDRFIRALTRLHNVQSLSLVDFSVFSCAHYRSLIEGLPLLRRLHVANSSSLSGQLSSTFRQEHQFRLLSLSGCSLVGRDLNFLASNAQWLFPNLIELDLSSNALRRNGCFEALECLLEQCPKLRILDLSYVDLRNEDLHRLSAAIVRCLPSLRCFIMSKELRRRDMMVWHPDSVLDGLIRPLMTSLPQLRFLHVPHRETTQPESCTALEALSECSLSSQLSSFVQGLHDHRRSHGFSDVRIKWTCISPTNEIICF